MFKSLCLDWSKRLLERRGNGCKVGNDMSVFSDGYLIGQMFEILSETKIRGLKKCTHFFKIKSVVLSVYEKLRVCMKESCLRIPVKEERLIKGDENEILNCIWILFVRYEMKVTVSKFGSKGFLTFKNSMIDAVRRVTNVSCSNFRFWKRSDELLPKLVGKTTVQEALDHVRQFGVEIPFSEEKITDERAFVFILHRFFSHVPELSGVEIKSSVKKKTSEEPILKPPTRPSKKTRGKKGSVSPPKRPSRRRMKKMVQKSVVRPSGRKNLASAFEQRIAESKKRKEEQAKANREKERKVIAEKRRMSVRLNETGSISGANHRMTRDRNRMQEELDRLHGVSKLKRKGYQTRIKKEQEERERVENIKKNQTRTRNAWLEGKRVEREKKRQRLEEAKRKRKEEELKKARLLAEKKRKEDELRKKMREEEIMRLKKLQGLKERRMKEALKFKAKKGTLPRNEDVSEKNLFKEDFFDFGDPSSPSHYRNQKKLICQTKSFVGRSRNPLTKKEEEFLALKLHSSSGERRGMNLVICLHICSTMGCFMDFGDGKNEVDGGSKLEVCKELIREVIRSKLKDEDRIGILVFDHNVRVIQRLEMVKNIDRDCLCDRIKEIQRGGGSCVRVALENAIQMFEGSGETNNNRIIFLSDKKPEEYGNNSSLVQTVTDVSCRRTKKIHFTFLGLLGENEEVRMQRSRVEQVCGNTRGSSFLRVKDTDGLKKLLDCEFDYLVGPCAYSVNIGFRSEEYRLKEVFSGSEVEFQGGAGRGAVKLEQVRSGDRSAVRGDSVVLCKLEKTGVSSSGKMEIITKYEDEDGNHSQTKEEVTVEERLKKLPKEEKNRKDGIVHRSGSYENKGVKKAVIFAHYNRIAKKVICDGNSGIGTVPCSFRGKKFKICEPTKQGIIEFQNYFRTAVPEHPGPEPEYPEPEICPTPDMVGFRMLGESVNEFQFPERYESVDEEPVEVEEEEIRGGEKFLFHREVNVELAMGQSQPSWTKSNILNGCYFFDGQCNKKIGAEVEIVFSFDVTGSMSSYINEVKRKLGEVVRKLVQDIPGIRIGLIAHSDYCDYQSSYVIRILDLTNNLNRLTNFITECGNGYGGDGDENYEHVLMETRNLSWTEFNPSRCLVMIGDCDPHPKNTYFGIDWEAELQKLKNMDVTCYGVKCGGSSFYQEIASRTGGRCFPLSNFSGMNDMFVGLCYLQSMNVAVQRQGNKILDLCRSSVEQYVSYFDQVKVHDFLSSEQIMEIHHAVQRGSGSITFHGEEKRVEVKADVSFLRLNDGIFFRLNNTGSEICNQLLQGGRKVTFIKFGGMLGFYCQLY